MANLSVTQEGPLLLAHLEQTSGTTIYNLTNHVEGRRYRLLLMRRHSVSDGVTSRIIVRMRASSAIVQDIRITNAINEDYVFMLPLGYELDDEWELVCIGKVLINLLYEEI